MIKTPNGVVHVSLAEALSKGLPSPGNLAVSILTHFSLAVEFYKPVGRDAQKPHNRDEVYFVTRGHGLLFDGEKRQPVQVGSFIFVPAGREHRFEEFSNDFAVWLAFYGPKGGETDANSVR
jgi:mannose-6-phosphate isomerase-like protein (cupin superfamily)